MFTIVKRVPAAVQIGDVTFHAGPGTTIHHSRAEVIGGCPTRIRGVHLAFMNGFTLSVQWGTGNYCEARDNADTDSSPNAELGLWRPDGSFAGDVEGWVDSATVLTLIPRVAALPDWDRRTTLADLVGAVKARQDA